MCCRRAKQNLGVIARVAFVERRQLTNGFGNHRTKRKREVMTSYAALDVSQETTAICVVDEQSRTCPSIAWTTSADPPSDANMRQSSDLTAERTLSPART